MAASSAIQIRSAGPVANTASITAGIARSDYGGPDLAGPTPHVACFGRDKIDPLDSGDPKISTWNHRSDRPARHCLRSSASRHPTEGPSLTEFLTENEKATADHRHTGGRKAPDST